MAAVCVAMAISGSALAPVRASTGSGTLVLGGKTCNLLAVPAAAPFGLDTACPGVRPGAAAFTDLGMCSFNFMWLGAGGTRYMGTAGHCILGGGEQAWAPGTGPVVRDSSGERVGEFAYAVLASPRDFALVRLDAGVGASPQMCHFGGPTGVNADRTTLPLPVVLHQYGQGTVISDLVPGRSLVALGMPSSDHVFAQGLVLPGDSGSGVISADGRAVGVVVTTGAHLGGLGLGGVDAGLAGLTRLGPQVARAASVLGTPLTLQTAPLL